MNTEEKKLYIAKFDPLIQLLADLNYLHFGINQKKLVLCELRGRDLVITGVPTALSALISLLWSSTTDYAFYMTEHEGSSAILVKYIR